MSVQQGYDAWAATYNSVRNLTRDLDERITRELLGAGRYQTILELGVGTGKNTPFFATIGERVISVDFSPEMIKQARAKAYDKRPSFVIADLTREWPVTAHSVNLVTCNLILEHIADLDRFFAEVQRVLMDGGQFFISELHPFKQYQGLKANFQVGDDKIEIPAFVHHVSDFVKAGERAGLTLKHLGEWWDAEDRLAPPRLVSFVFEKAAG
jgi:malonyl-CoA O-methyltransferase